MYMQYFINERIVSIEHSCRKHSVFGCVNSWYNKIGVENSVKRNELLICFN